MSIDHSGLHFYTSIRPKPQSATACSAPTTIDQTSLITKASQSIQLSPMINESVLSTSKFPAGNPVYPRITVNRSPPFANHNPYPSMSAPVQLAPIWTSHPPHSVASPQSMPITPPPATSSVSTSKSTLRPPIRVSVSSPIFGPTVSPSAASEPAAKPGVGSTPQCSSLSASARAEADPTTTMPSPPRVSKQLNRSGSTGTNSHRGQRRSMPKSPPVVKYPLVFPPYQVPIEMQIPHGPPDRSWQVMPPEPRQIKARRYATAVDERNFFTVLEYELNGQTIIWDYYTGYVHLTGIWKAVGNNKADIVKLVDNSPELEPVIRRVRGGFLKIQGTWVPFDVARELAKHVCYYIRFALVPLFGPKFPEECMQPHQPGFGNLLLHPSPKLHIPGDYARSSPESVSGLPSKPERKHDHKGDSLAAKASVAKPRSPSLTTTHTASLTPPPDLSRPVATVPLNSHPIGSQFASSPKLTKADHRHRRPSSHLPLNRTYFSNYTSSEEALYDENVFEDEDLEADASPPMPRKVSFRDEARVSESLNEFLEMLKATRTLQQISSGKPVKDHGGSFECAGQQFIWDGSDKLTRTEYPSSASLAKPASATPHRLPLTTILNA